MSFLRAEFAGDGEKEPCSKSYLCPMGPEYCVMLMSLPHSPKMISCCEYFELALAKGLRRTRLMIRDAKLFYMRSGRGEVPYLDSVRR